MLEESRASQPLGSIELGFEIAEQKKFDTAEYKSTDTPQYNKIETAEYKYNTAQHKYIETAD